MRLDNYTRKTLSVQITCNYQYGKGERELGIWRIFDKNIGICTINEAIINNFNEIKQYYAVKFKPILRQIHILICFIHFYFCILYSKSDIPVCFLKKRPNED